MTAYVHSADRDTAPCGCKEQQPCSCEPKGIREVPGDCKCRGPERCGGPCLERPVYSAGQLLTADSLRLGQTYTESRFALRRFVDGVGVVCGLHVRCDPDRPGWVIVDPGYAIDCCGHDIVICDPVRFNVCKAITACERPADPCEPVEEPAPPKNDQELSELSPVGPSGSRVARGTITGRVSDGGNQQPLPGASVTITETGLSVLADEQGRYAIFPASQMGQTYTVQARFPGYTPARRQCTFTPSRITVADFELTKVAKEEPTPATAYRGYLLRVEGLWEGRSPVPVVTSRASCDPRPSCRPSKEVGSVRLCVAPMEDPTGAARVRKRRREFRAIGSPLLQRIDHALEARENLPQSEKAKNPPELVVANTLLAAIREEPLRTSCNLADLICDVRRLIAGESTRCFSFPAEAEPNGILAGFVGQLIDDLREEYLMLGCDDCCEQTGIRLAHIVTQDLLGDCGRDGCSIAGVDTHAPARETLHPRSSWWVADHVIVHDAYFRGLNEAGVLLTGRGLTVTWRQAAESGFTPTIPATVKKWLEDNGSSELDRLGVYQDSVLYAPFGTAVVLWTVGGRVVAITYTEPRRDRLSFEIQSSRLTDYLRHPFLTPTLAPTTPGVSLGGTLTPRAAEAPSAAETLDPGAMDPAPLKELIDGIGPKIESALFRLGRTTLRSVLRTSEEEVTGLMRSDQLERIKAQARRILDGKDVFAARDLEEWAAAARVRKERLERSPE